MTTAQFGNLAEVMRLREQIASLQRRRAEPEALAVPDALSSLFPSGGLRPGAAYAIAPGSMSLLLALMGAASREGAWGAVVGVPELSVEAAAGYGVDLDRLVLIPHPGDRWLQVAAAAAEVFPLVAVRPTQPPRDAEVARLEGRLRDRGGALLALGAWPGAEARIETSDVQWQGIGRGHGAISGRVATVSLTGRRAPRPRSVRVLLPGPTGGVEPFAPVHDASAQDAVREGARNAPVREGARNLPVRDPALRPAHLRAVEPPASTTAVRS